MQKSHSFLQAIAAATIFLFSNISQAQQETQFPVISLNAGIHLIKAEVAASEAQREQGLMFREKLGQNQGMVFLFGAPQQVCMWMKNTLIPLSVAFIDQSGVIVNIEEMKEQTLDSHCGAQNVSYALEMTSGWFKQKGIKAGMAIGGLPATH
jgi:uncharacterized membrane protein (UPF0127 family)